MLKVRRAIREDFPTVCAGPFYASRNYLRSESLFHRAPNGCGASLFGRVQDSSIGDWTHWARVIMSFHF